MNEKKVAFITCVNDEIEYAECRYYLERLKVPEGWSKDIISIWEASSMAAGYNAGMRDTDAKYKVYLHQDVFIKNMNFIEDLVQVFAHDKMLGMLGMVGRKSMGTNGREMEEWDTGRIIFGKWIMEWDVLDGNPYVEVAEADGLLLATQYDIPWREDIFDGWDFYDFSQCMEFKKAGYKIGVPRQEDIWCCHDGSTSILAEYFNYYGRFLQEYIGMPGVPAKITEEEQLGCKSGKEHQQKVVELQNGLKGLLDMGRKDELREIFSDKYFLESPYLMEYAGIVYVDLFEEKRNSDLRFWDKEMTVSQLMLKWQHLKFALKRIEYDADGEETKEIPKYYSRIAVEVACNVHITDKNKVYKKLGMDF